MIRAVLAALALILVLSAPAAAHKLKVFATVEGDAVVGYAFFIGGGRAMDTPFTARTGGGAEIASGRTDEAGGFRVIPAAPVTSDIVITVDTREGHIASATVPASRFGTGAPAAAAAPTTATVAPAPPAAGDAPTADATAAVVEAAVQRQVAPLLERIEAMDSRLRFTDALSGIFLIIGAAGMVLWFRGRTR
jgi:nickel transport protein